MYDFDKRRQIDHINWSMNKRTIEQIELYLYKALFTPHLN